jgi:hypothetical protein
MSTRARKRQKTDPSPVKPKDTLLHFFAKPFLGGKVKTKPSPPKSDSDSGSIHDELRRRSDVSDFGSVPVKQELTPPRMPMDDSPLKPPAMEFEATFTEPNDNCSPTPNEEMNIDPFDQVDFRDDELQDDLFRDEEIEFPYEGADEIEDDFDVKPEIRHEPPDTTIDTGPSCPFCNFSFRGLTENVFTLAMRLT